MTETRFDTLHESVLQRWFGMSVAELLEEREKINKKLELITNESHGIRIELNRVLAHLNTYINRRVEEESENNSD